jgi:hypothetical protein
MQLVSRARAAGAGLSPLSVKTKLRSSKCSTGSPSTCAWLRASQTEIGASFADDTSTDGVAANSASVADDTSTDGFEANSKKPMTTAAAVAIITARIEKISLPVRSKPAE